MPPRSREELEATNVVDPELRKAIEQYPLPPSMPTTDMPASRANRNAHLNKRRPLTPISAPVPGVSEKDLKVPMRDGHEITVRVYTPEESKVLKGGSPLIMMFHEGGWCWGDLDDEALNCRMFSRDLGAVCINVDYRLAPEHKFPIGVNDCWDALKWAAANASSLKADPKQGFIVGGASAGGNISSVLTHIARDEKFEPKLTGQFLCVPGLLPEDVVPEKYKAEYLSRLINHNDPVLPKIGSMKELYGCDHSDPLYVPFNHPNGHDGVPPAFFQICGLDPLRDEGLIYERVLREEYGIPTRLSLYKGYGHMFWTNYPTLPLSNKVVEDALEGVRWLLSLSRT